MIVKTRKYQLPKNLYVKLALLNILKKQWWLISVPIAIAAITFFVPNTIWFYIIAVVAIILYVLFWAIQFAGVTQLPQNQMMFDKLSYEIDSRQVMIKLNPKQGSPVPWTMVKSAYKNKDAFFLVLSKGQFIHLPFKIFNSDNDVRFIESILKRKEFIKSDGASAPKSMSIAK